MPKPPNDKTPKQIERHQSERVAVREALSTGRNEVSITRIPELTILIDNAKAIVGKDLAFISSKANHCQLDKDDAKSLREYIDVLLKLQKRELELADRMALDKMTDAELIEKLQEMTDHSELES